MKNKLNILFPKTFLLNSLMTEFLILMKPAHWFAVQKQWAGSFMIGTSVMKELKILT